MRNVVLSLMFALWVPLNSQAASIELSFITTSHANPIAEAVVVSGGRLWHKRSLVQGALLVRHKDTLFLYDAGLGTQIDFQFEQNGWLDKRIFAHSVVNPVVEQLALQGISNEDIDFIIPSHLHWDHASGLPDFPATPIWIQATELASARLGMLPSFLPETLSEQLNWKEINLEHQPFLGFEKSLDLFGDGRVVLVGLEGHTAGQLGLYIEVSADKKYFFVGDASWTLEGVQQNQKRSWLVKRLVRLNHDESQSGNTLQAIHLLSKSDPNLLIVPAHDEHVVKKLPAFPEGISWNSGP